MHTSKTVKGRWLAKLEHLESPAAEHLDLLPEESHANVREGDTIASLFLRRETILSHRKEVKEFFGEHLPGA